MARPGPAAAADAEPALRQGAALWVTATVPSRLRLSLCIPLSDACASLLAGLLVVRDRRLDCLGRGGNWTVNRRHADELHVHRPGT